MAEPASRPLALAARIAASFDEDGIPYAIGGALALGAWGAQRATNDVDLTAFVEEAALGRVFDALERAGVFVDRDDATRGVARLGFFKARGGRTEVDVFLTSHPQYTAMKERRRSLEIGDGTLWFISPEDLAIHKLIFARGKDSIVLERLFAAQPALDVGYIEGWLDQMLPPGDRRFGTPRGSTVPLSHLVRVKARPPPATRGRRSRTSPRPPPLTASPRNHSSRRRVSAAIADIAIAICSSVTVIANL